MKTGEKVKNFINKNVFSYKDKNYDYARLFNLIKKIKYKHVGKHMDYLVDVVSVKGEKAICLFLQETKGIRDWISNFTFWPVSTKAYKGWKNKLKYHKGFFEEYQSARDEILKDIRALIDEDVKKIFVAGWSAGAAIGAIASEDIYFHFGIKPTFIGYAGARPCANKHTRDFVQNVLADDSVSFVFGMDIVARLPPFYPTLEDIIFYFEIEENIFQKFISLFRTRFWHTRIDLAIMEFLS